MSLVKEALNKGIAAASLMPNTISEGINTYCVLQSKINKHYLEYVVSRLCARVQARIELCIGLRDFAVAHAELINWPN